jgi:hypothetical protein
LLIIKKYLFFVLKTLPDGGKLDGIIRSFRKTSNQYKILYQDGEAEYLTEEEVAKMIGVEYSPKPVDGNEGVKMEGATADESVLVEPITTTEPKVVVEATTRPQQDQMFNNGMLVQKVCR